MSHKRGCGARPFTVGRKQFRSIRPMPRRTTTSRSPTSMRGSSTKRARRTRRRSSSSRTTLRYARTTSSSRKSMTARAKRRISNAGLAAAAALAAIAVACGTDSFEIPIETPIQPKLDVSAFQRVLVAGFVAGGSEDVDANQETVRLLRSQLRTKSSLKVVEAEILPLMAIAQDQSKASGEEANGNGNDHGNTGPQTVGGADRGGAGVSGQQPAPQVQNVQALPAHIKEEKDLEPYERLFANTAYWKRIGEEYQNPLIVTGTVLFTPHSRSGFVQREVEQYDAFGRRRVVPVRAYVDRKGF